MNMFVVGQTWRDVCASFTTSHSSSWRDLTRSEAIFIYQVLLSSLVSPSTDRWRCSTRLTLIYLWHSGNNARRLHSETLHFSDWPRRFPLSSSMRRLDSIKERLCSLNWIGWLFIFPFVYTRVALIKDCLPFNEWWSLAMIIPAPKWMQQSSYGRYPLCNRTP